MRRPSAALVVAILALVVATTGTSIAATRISGQSIQNHTITANKLAKGAVTGAAVKPRSLTALALADGVIVNNTVIAPAGPKGDTGTPGATAVVAFDPSKVILVAGNEVGLILPSDARTSTASCPPGSYITGGGYSDLGGSGSAGGAMLIPTENWGSANGWLVTVRNFGGAGSGKAWHAIAYCATS